MIASVICVSVFQIVPSCGERQSCDWASSSQSIRESSKQWRIQRRGQWGRRPYPILASEFCSLCRLFPNTTRI